MRDDMPRASLICAFLFVSNQSFNAALFISTISSSQDFTKQITSMIAIFLDKLIILFSVENNPSNKLFTVFDFCYLAPVYMLFDSSSITELVRLYMRNYVFLFFQTLSIFYFEILSDLSEITTILYYTNYLIMIILLLAPFIQDDNLLSFQDYVYQTATYLLQSSLLSITLFSGFNLGYIHYIGVVLLELLFKYCNKYTRKNWCSIKGVLKIVLSLLLCSTQTIARKHTFNEDLMIVRNRTLISYFSISFKFIALVVYVIFNFTEIIIKPFQEELLNYNQIRSIHIVVSLFLSGIYMIILASPSAFVVTFQWRIFQIDSVQDFNKARMLVRQTPSRIEEFQLFIDDSFYSQVKANQYLLANYCNGVCMAAYGLEKAVQQQIEATNFPCKFRTNHRVPLIICENCRSENLLINQDIPNQTVCKLGSLKKEKRLQNVDQKIKFVLARMERGYFNKATKKYIKQNFSYHNVTRLDWIFTRQYTVRLMIASFDKHLKSQMIYSPARILYDLYEN